MVMTKATTKNQCGIHFQFGLMVLCFVVVLIDLFSMLVGTLSTLLINIQWKVMQIAHTESTERFCCNEKLEFNI